MGTRTRVYFAVAAAALALIGGLIGWAVAVSRQASTNDTITSALLTGVFTLLGSAIGLGVPLFQDWEKNRPNLKLQVSYRCLHAQPGFRMTFLGEAGDEMPTTWIRCDADRPAASLFVLLDVQAQNRSHLDDAVTQTRMEIPWGERTMELPAKMTDGSDFRGESIPAHQLRNWSLCLMFDRANYGSTVNWNPDESVTWTLVAKTINDQVIIETMKPAGHFDTADEQPIRELEQWQS